MPIDPNVIPFPLRVQAATGMTQAQIAQTVGMGLRTIQRWFVGQSSGPCLPQHHAALARAAFPISQ